MARPPIVRLRGVSISAALVAAVVTLQPGSSAACGGTFCDSGPTAMPVDQTGENVLFVMDGQYVEAHVQIQYTPGASRFAWVVPMPKVPAVSVGSALLFNTLMQGSVPTFGNQLSYDDCGSNCFNGGAGGSGGFAGSGGTAGAGTGGSGGSGGGPTVVLKETVGAFEVVVLQGGTAQEVSDWLTANSYASTATAPSLLASYVAKSYVFVAVKLTARSDVGEIHPLVFRYQGTEPCIPLKLTAVAAAQDMGVRAFFLGDDRVFPTNYKHVVVNPLRLDWRNNASNYKATVSRAVDSAVADGRAFITEYAGPTQSVTSSAGVYSTAWNASVFATANPTQVLQLLSNQGLAYCYYAGQCQMNHPLLLGLLHEYLPVPSGMDDATYYAGLASSTADAGAFPAWDGAAFAAALDERVIKPGQHAADLLATWPYLTRLYTTISAPEMTLDPEFVARPDFNAPTVQLGGFSTQRFACDQTSGFKLPGTDWDVGADPSGVFPIFSSQMPFAERIEEYAAVGAPIVLVDNKAKIEAQVTKWNDSVGWPAPPPPPPDPNGCYGGAGGSGAAGGSGGAGGNAGVVGFGGFAAVSGAAGTAGAGAVTGDGGPNPIAGGSGGDGGKMEASGGCSTTGDRDAGGTVAGLALLALVGRLRRARRS